MICYLHEDFRQKARWVYGSITMTNYVKALVTDGSFAMFLFRLSQTFYRLHLGFIGAILLKINGIISQTVIGRRAEFGPGFVILHSTGVVINGRVHGGRNIFVEHGVTIGEEKQGVPVLGDDIFIGAGAKIFGGIRIGNRVRIGANAVVVKDIPDDSTAVGIPARVLEKKSRGK